MLTLLLSILISAALVLACQTAQTEPGTATFAGIVGFIASYFLLGFIVRKRVTKVQNQLQDVVMSGQKRMQRKIQQFQSKPGGNIKLIQRQIEADQAAVLREALGMVERLEPFKKWNMLMGRQIATMRMQFHYQLKEFEQVDAILASSGMFKGVLMMEPMTVAMKMARQYKNDDVAGAEKLFKRKIKWFRGDRSTLLYGLMSWIYLKKGEAEQSRQLLLKGKESTGNQTLAANWEFLSNNKEKSFSNAGLGEEWYGLYLENPPTPKQQRIRGNARASRGF